ncbi:hypothetical protein BD413DRAFT_182465 [Trametes elegans]|nr:hypothetical protein BD413DRAFT_182465 [Trametes elegans]
MFPRWGLLLHRAGIAHEPPTATSRTPARPRPALQHVNIAVTKTEKQHRAEACSPSLRGVHTTYACVARLVPTRTLRAEPRVLLRSITGAALRPGAAPPCARGEGAALSGSRLRALPPVCVSPSIYSGGDAQHSHPTHHCNSWRMCTLRSTLSCGDLPEIKACYVLLIRAELPGRPGRRVAGEGEGVAHDRLGRRPRTQTWRASQGGLAALHRIPPAHHQPVWMSPRALATRVYNAPRSARRAPQGCASHFRPSTPFPPFVRACGFPANDFFRSIRHTHTRTHTHTLSLSLSLSCFWLGLFV